jgi:hypothetical protein
VDQGTQIKVLGRLAQSNTSASDEAIGRACQEAFATLETSREYEALEFAIDVLGTVGYRRSNLTVAALEAFVRSVGERHIVFAHEYAALFGAISKYRNANRLKSRAIEVLAGLRYFETSSVVNILLAATVQAEESVRKDAISALSKTAKYDLSVYYGQGPDSGGGIGAAPQLSIIDTLEKKSDDELRIHLQGVLSLVDGLLSTTMDSTSWSSTAVTLSRLTVPADKAIKDIRKRTIALLRRVYSSVESVSQKLSVIRAMNAATRAERRSAVDQEHADMIAANAEEVLGFFAEIVKGEDLQVVQKLEHDTYWIHYHSPSKDVRAKALRVKAVIDEDKEYVIYKTLVGFEGVFGDWSDRTSDGLSGRWPQDRRVKEARVLAAGIEEDGFDIWTRRILAFAKTESDDLATFPVFYEFLAIVAKSYPAFALQLLIQDADALSKFLIPILRGLWVSEKRSDVMALMKRWVQAEPARSTFLYACTKFFLSTTDIDVELLGQLLKKAVETRDVFVLRQIASVSMARSETIARGELKVLFLSAISKLTELRDANWVREVWFRDEAKKMLVDLTHEERAEVLKNLRFLPQIDYQAEDLLAAMAEYAPEDVLDFLCRRLYAADKHAKELEDQEWGRYEELPFQFHGLQEPLSRDPTIVVRKVWDYYQKDPSLFEFKGARLLQAIFPTFEENFQLELLRLIREGGDAQLEFVVGVMRAYSGEAFLYPVAKELIKRLPSHSTLVSEIKMALESTGVVSGEYGFSEAYEKKRLEVLDWLQNPDDKIRTFAAEYISELEEMRDSEKARADESSALRRFTYGED